MFTSLEDVPVDERQPVKFRLSPIEDASGLATRGYCVDNIDERKFSVTFYDMVNVLPGDNLLGGHRRVQAANNDFGLRENLPGDGNATFSSRVIDSKGANAYDFSARVSQLVAEDVPIIDHSVVYQREVVALLTRVTDHQTQPMNDNPVLSNRPVRRFHERRIDKHDLRLPGPGNNDTEPGEYPGTLFVRFKYFPPGRHIGLGQTVGQFAIQEQRHTLKKLRHIHLLRQSAEPVERVLRRHWVTPHCSHRINYSPG